MRAGLSLLVCIALLLPLSARADERKVCIEAADSGQTLRDQGKLVEARESFLKCARDACPSIVAKQCGTWLGDVEREIPTVSFHVTDWSGKDLVGAEVWVDAAPTPLAVDGRAVPIDPGVHRLRFAHGSDGEVAQEVVIHEGEKVRPIEVRFGASGEAGAAAAAPPGATVRGGESTRGRNFRFPIVAGISLGVGAASFVTMAVLVATTASDVNHLRSTCAGSCSPSDVSSANTRIVLANVTMGVGIAAVGLAGASLLVVNLGHHDSAAQAAWVFGAGPGSIAVAGSF